MLPTLYLFGETLHPSGATPDDYWLLLLSGALGIGLADSMFFRSLNILGAGLSAIVDCLYSPSIISLSLIFLGEKLTFLQIIGALMIISAVLTSTYRPGSSGLSRRDLLVGISLLLSRRIWSERLATQSSGCIGKQPMGQPHRVTQVWIR